MIDLYFEYDYGKLYEKIENGICDIFDFKCLYGRISHMFIKREIPLCVDGTKYFDIVTPYGYGGPIIIDHKEECIKELIEEFNLAFKDYCDNHNIVSEFIRFHPIVGNAKDFKSMYRIEIIRKTVGTNIRDYKDPIASEFSKSARKSIRRALDSGLTFKITEKPDSLNNFKEIYYSTMDRNEASEYYYFDDSYFDSCLKYFKEKIILVEVFYEEKVIAAGFYFVYGKMIHAHLSGTLKDYLSLSPAYIIKYATALWAKQNGIEFIHYGGGTTNSENDPLYNFKKKFGQNTDFQFYIGKKVWNNEVYHKLCKLKGKDECTDFFPAYRKQ